MTLVQLPAAAHCQLWRADLDSAPTPAAVACLSDDEWERARRFVFARDRHRFVAAHAALRSTLAQQTGIPGALLDFSARRVRQAGPGRAGRAALQPQPQPVGRPDRDQRRRRDRRRRRTAAPDAGCRRAGRRLFHRRRTAGAGVVAARAARPGLPGLLDAQGGLPQGGRHGARHRYAQLRGRPGGGARARSGCPSKAGWRGSPCAPSTAARAWCARSPGCSNPSDGAEAAAPHPILQDNESYA